MATDAMNLLGGEGFATGEIDYAAMEEEEAKYQAEREKKRAAAKGRIYPFMFPNPKKEQPNGPNGSWLAWGRFFLPYKQGLVLVLTHRYAAKPFVPKNPLDWDIVCPGEMGQSCTYCTQVMKKLHITSREDLLKAYRHDMGVRQDEVGFETRYVHARYIFQYTDGNMTDGAVRVWGYHRSIATPVQSLYDLNYQRAIAPKERNKSAAADEAEPVEELDKYDVCFTKSVPKDQNQFTKITAIDVRHTKFRRELLDKAWEQVKRPLDQRHLLWDYILSRYTPDIEEVKRVMAMAYAELGDECYKWQGDDGATLLNEKPTAKNGKKATVADEFEFTLEDEDD